MTPKSQKNAWRQNGERQKVWRQTGGAKTSGSRYYNIELKSYYLDANNREDSLRYKHFYRNGNIVGPRN